MKNVNPIYQELKTFRDELRVQSHLMSMDAKDQFEALEKRFAPFERKLEDYMQKFGELNEGFWVGNKEEIEKYKKEYKDLRNSHIEGK